MNYSFAAWAHRAKNIPRWSLMKTLVNHDVATHSFECTVLAFIIASIDKDVFGNEDTDPNYVGMLATMHEGSEFAGCGDFNSVAKNYDEETKSAIKRLESIFEDKLLSTLPTELLDRFTPLIKQDKSNRMVRLAKAADILSAFIEASEEVNLGNHEFDYAKNANYKKLLMFCEEFESVQYFCEHFLSSFKDSFDQLHKTEA